jgi:hypothetical protein
MLNARKRHSLTVTPLKSFLCESSVHQPETQRHPGYTGAVLKHCTRLVGPVVGHACAARSAPDQPWQAWAFYWPCLVNEAIYAEFYASVHLVTRPSGRRGGCSKCIATAADLIMVARPGPPRATRTHQASPRVPPARCRPDGPSQSAGRVAPSGSARPALAAWAGMAVTQPAGRASDAVLRERSAEACRAASSASPCDCSHLCSAVPALNGSTSTRRLAWIPAQPQHADVAMGRLARQLLSVSARRVHRAVRLSVTAGLRLQQKWMCARQRVAVHTTMTSQRVTAFYLAYATAVSVVYWLRAEQQSP